MGNCLVTKLKSDVNNDSLEVLGYAKLVFETATISNIRITAQSGKTVNVYSVDGNFVIGGNSTNNADIEDSNITVPAACTLYIQKENLYRLDCDWNIIVADISSLEYSDVVLLTLRSASGELKSINKLPNIAQLHVENSTNLTGKLEDLSGNTHLTNFGFYQIDISGNIQALATGAPNITTISAVNTSVGGEILDLVAGMVNVAGRSTGTISGFGLANVKFNNIYYSTLSSADFVLTWDGITKIAITTDSAAYTYGYTQQEAEAAFPGKSSYIAVDGAY